MSFGDKLKMLRESFDLKQEDLGKRVQLSKPNISKYESGQIEPSIGTIIKFCEIFGVSSDYLLDVPLTTSNTHLTESEESLLKKYHQLNTIGKDRANEYIDGLLLNEMYTKEGKKTVIDFNDKVRTVDSDDELKAVAYGDGNISDDETVKHT